MSFSQQISKFIELKKKWSDKDRAEAIYMIYIGADDYLNFAKAHPNANLVEQTAHVAYVLQKISRDLMVIYFYLFKKSLYLWIQLGNVAT